MESRDHFLLMQFDLLRMFYSLGQWIQLILSFTYMIHDHIHYNHSVIKPIYYSAIPQTILCSILELVLYFCAVFANFTLRIWTWESHSYMHIYYYIIVFSRWFPCQKVCMSCIINRPAFLFPASYRFLSSSSSQYRISSKSFETSIFIISSHIKCTTFLFFLFYSHR